MGTNKGWRLCEVKSAPTQGCETCVEQFASAGGCGLVITDTDPSSLLPDGCDHCAEEAMAHCLNGDLPDNYGESGAALSEHQSTVSIAKANKKEDTVCCRF